MSDWTEVTSDEEFAGFFTGKKIVEATPRHPNGTPYMHADMFWRLTDGRWLAMVSEDTGYCETCAGHANVYYTLAPAPKAVRPLSVQRSSPEEKP